jgi:hypothetical protein
LPPRRPTPTTVKTTDGRITGAEVELPAGTELPGKVEAWAIGDVFPIGTRKLG